MKGYFALFALVTLSILLFISVQSPGLAQSKGKQPIQPKKDPPPFKQNPPFPGESKQNPELAKQRTEHEVRLLAQNNAEMKIRENAIPLLQKQAVENAQTQAKILQQWKQSMDNMIAKLPAEDKALAEKRFENQYAIKKKLQLQSLAYQKTVLVDGRTLTGQVQGVTVNPKENRAVANRVSDYYSAANTLGVKLDAFGRPANSGSVGDALANSLNPGFKEHAHEAQHVANGSSMSTSQAGTLSSSSVLAGGPALGSAQAGIPSSALIIPPNVDGTASSNIPGYVPSLGAVAIANVNDGSLPSVASAGTLPSVASGYQLVQTLPDATSANVQERAKIVGDSLLVEGTDAAASVRQLTRFVRLTNASDKKATFYILYETADSEGNKQWSPPKENGVGYGMPIEVAAGQSIDLKDGDWRVSAVRARIWAVGEARQWDRYQKIDFWFVPEVDEKGNHSYMAPSPETMVFSIV